MTCSILLFHAIVFKRENALTVCFEHSNLLKVTRNPVINHWALKGSVIKRTTTRHEDIEAEPRFSPSELLKIIIPLKFNYERFNCNNFNIRYWSWNYRGCWHQTCPPIDFWEGFKFPSFQL